MTRGAASEDLGHRDTSMSRNPFVGNMDLAEEGVGGHIFICACNVSYWEPWRVVMLDTLIVVNSTVMLCRIIECVSKAVKSNPAEVWKYTFESVLFLIDEMCRVIFIRGGTYNMCAESLSIFLWFEE